MTEYNTMKRVYHTWDKWESFHYNFFGNTAPNGIKKPDAEKLYYTLLSDIPEFERIMDLILEEWPLSCEHNLTNPTLNRIAWMGQASLAYKYKIPSGFRGGFNLLTQEQQKAANSSALKYINKWMEKSNYPPIEEKLAAATDVKQPLY